jgi:signal recognition particle receptor subunit beta
MAEPNAELRARIVYWGADGAGKSANLHYAWRKLRPDHRGPLQAVPTALDPSVTYEVLPITLGDVAGSGMRLQVVAPPGGREHATTRKQLLDRVDGVVLVVDARRERLDANLAAFEELRGALGAYGRSLESLPVVVQYNQRDRSDDYTLEELHRKLDLRGAPVFEAVATEGKGVLQTLTTISKQVIRHLRERAAAEPAPRTASPKPAPAPRATPRLEPEPAPGHALEVGLAAEARDPARAARVAATTGQAAALLEQSWGEVTAEITGPGARVEPAVELDEPPTLVAIGRARQTGERSFSVPVTLRDAAGRTFSLAVGVQLDVSLLPGPE